MPMRMRLLVSLTMLAVTQRMRPPQKWGRFTLPYACQMSPTDNCTRRQAAHAEGPNVIFSFAGARKPLGVRRLYLEVLAHRTVMTRQPSHDVEYL
jgi:hypothetical protein